MVLILSFLMAYGQAAEARVDPASEGHVDRVVDGDTANFVLAGIHERVRFLNIDTPEVGTCMASQATAFTSRQLPVGKAVALRYDVDLRDPYDRLLALVKPVDGEWLSVSLAERGLGFPVSIAPNDAYYGRVVSAAGRAKRGGVGMFSPRRSCTPVARTRHANQLVSQAQAMPVRSSAQYKSATSKLNQAAGLLAMAAATRYGIDSSYFTKYTKTLQAPVLRRVKSVRVAKTRQWNIVRNSASNDTPSNSPSNSNNNDGWWPPGVSHGYTGPRCYRPGGVIWYPC